MADREPSSSLKAGPELNALVAEKVLGLIRRDIEPTWYQRDGQPPRIVTLFLHPDSGLVWYSYDKYGCNAIMHRNGVDDKDGSAEVLPSYSEDIAAAWEVVEQIGLFDARPSIDLDVGLALQRESGGDWVVKYRFGCVVARGNTAPLAICLAALEASGG